MYELFVRLHCSVKCRFMFTNFTLMSNVLMMCFHVMLKHTCKSCRVITQFICKLVTYLCLWLIWPCFVVDSWSLMSHWYPILVCLDSWCFFSWHFFKVLKSHLSQRNESVFRWTDSKWSSNNCFVALTYSHIPTWIFLWAPQDYNHSVLFIHTNLPQSVDLMIYVLLVLNIPCWKFTRFAL